MPFNKALDIVYSLILDDVPSLASRHEARDALESSLARPLNDVEAQEHDRGEWGLSPEAITAAEAKDAMWGSLTYEATG